MSRRFQGANYTQNEYIQSQSSTPAAAVTVAGWFKIDAIGAFGCILWLKDVAVGQSSLELQADGTLFATFGGLDRGALNMAPIVVPGSGYVSLDTGFVKGGIPDTAGNDAEYRIGGAPGGIPTNPVGLLGGGTGYKVGETYTTVTGGGQPGSGSGLTLTAAAIINQTNASRTTTTVVPTGVWTHIALTWSSVGDGTLHVYINGVEASYATDYTISNVADATTGGWVIGGDTFSFTGDDVSIAEFAVYSTALSGAQVAALAASTTGATGVPIDYWHLCGFSSPEPNAANPTNTGTLSSPAPTRNGNSPGYSSCSAPPNAGGGGFSTMAMTASGSPQEATGPSRNAIMRRRTSAVSMS